MSKRLPYFQFEPAEYITKDIQFCSYAAQGVFINICAIYWQRDCVLTLEQVRRRFKEDKLIDELISEGVFSIVDENIVIGFLDSQHDYATVKSVKNSKNGKLGGRPKKPTKSETKPNALINESQTKGNKIREDNIIEDETINKEQYTHENKFCEDVIKYFNETCKDLANVGKLTPQRISLIEARNKEHGKNVIKNVIMSVNENDFYCGRQSNSDWKATFDWVFKASNFLKIKEADIVNKPNSFYGLSKASIQEKINYTMRRQG